MIRTQSTLRTSDTYALVGFTAINALAVVIFGWDKWRAGRLGGRTAESSLILLGALGGWPGGAMAMILFRHKTAKGSFKFKYALALIPFALEIWAFFHWR